MAAAQQPQDLEVQSTTFRAPFVLRVQAIMWRFLMSIGMFIGRLAPPRPIKPLFTRTIPTTLSPNSGSVKIHFYVPTSYPIKTALSSKKRYPCIVNFHGGGFTIGSATDDARWASAVVRELDAIVASVDYRRAPEHPFPTAVEDGVDAIMYLSKHAKELHIDEEKIAVSGFSSGGNMAFTVPLRLSEELFPDWAHGNTANLDAAAPRTAPGHGRNTSTIVAEPHLGRVSEVPESPVTPSHSTSNGDSVEDKDGSNADDPGSPASTVSAKPAKRPSTTIARSSRPLKLAAIISWYPSTDYTQTREERRATNVRKDMELSATFTTLFDSSYLQPPTLNTSNPYLSPGVAPTHVLANLPQDIILYICEYDMLAAEGRRMRDRLEELGKEVRYTEVKGVPHGWDKAPNPLAEAPGVREHYKTACQELKAIFRRVDRAREEEREPRDSFVGRRLSRISGDWGRRSVDSVRRSMSVRLDRINANLAGAGGGSQRRDRRSRGERVSSSV